MTAAPFSLSYGSVFISVLNFLPASFAPRTAVSPHRHPYTEFIIVTAGSVRYRFGSRRIDAVSGDIVCIPPETEHVRTAANRMSIFGFHLHLTDIRTIAVPPLTLHISGGARDALPLLAIAAKESASALPERSAVLRHTASAAIILLLRSAIAAHASTKKPPAFLSALTIINDTIRGDIRAADVARAAGCSSRHLNRHFHEQSGRSLKQYILEKKLILAYSDLIAAPAMPVRAVARGVGFTDAGYFTRLMSKRFGRTPSEIRGTEQH